MSSADRPGRITFVTIVRLVGIRGALRGSRPWLYLGLAAWVLRIAGRLASRQPVVVTERLRPGQRILVTHLKRNQV